MACSSLDRPDNGYLMAIVLPSLKGTDIEIREKVTEAIEAAKAADCTLTRKPTANASFGILISDMSFHQFGLELAAINVYHGGEVVPLKKYKHPIWPKVLEALKFAGTVSELVTEILESQAVDRQFDDMVKEFGGTTLGDEQGEEEMDEN
ncbi:hypothetical protein MMC10_008703 [Thelotrema lepadinum]|nr:hypothetical protein [Thelotrema lepadinum]